MSEKKKPLFQRCGSINHIHTVNGIRPDEDGDVKFGFMIIHAGIFDNRDIEPTCNMTREEYVAHIKNSTLMGGVLMYHHGASVEYDDDGNEVYYPNFKQYVIEKFEKAYIKMPSGCPIDSAGFNFNTGEFTVTKAGEGPM